MDIITNTFPLQEKGDSLEEKLHQGIPKVLVASIDSLASDEVTETFYSE